LGRPGGTAPASLGGTAITQYGKFNIDIDGSSLKPVTLGSGASQIIVGDPDPQGTFEAGVRRLLDTIKGRKVGLQVLGGIPKGKRVTIVPYFPAALVCNAAADTVNAGRVEIDPKNWMAGSLCNKDGSAGADADEVLLHEMLHAYRALAGHVRMDACQVAPDKQYDNIEEFWAIVVTNVYLSEKGKTLLRQDHASFVPLKPAWRTSAGFLTDPDLLKWSRALLRQEETLLKAIDDSLAATTPFNPFHELLAHPQKFREMDLREEIKGLARDANQAGPAP
jgi:hypothetical protein